MQWPALKRGCGIRRKSNGKCYYRPSKICRQIYWIIQTWWIIKFNTWSNRPIRKHLWVQLKRRKLREPITVPRQEGWTEAKVIRGKIWREASPIRMRYWCIRKFLRPNSAIPPWFGRKILKRLFTRINYVIWRIPKIRSTILREISRSPKINVHIFYQYKAGISVTKIPI